MAEAQGSEGGLKRTLTAANLVALGVGGIIGAGLFVRTAAAAAQAAGPGVTLSFIIAAIGCAFAGLCYAEFAASIPIAGSAYAYAYITLGEIVAWIIGWALIMEYALGAATVSIAWSEYLNNLLGGAIPYAWCHSPFEHIYSVLGSGPIAQILATMPDISGAVKENVLPLSTDEYKALPAALQSLVQTQSGIMNLPALFILTCITLLLIRGTQESAFVNNIIVFLKVSIVIVFIVAGWGYINPDNFSPYLIPADYPGHTGFFKHGWGGVVGGAGIVFFAFIGFDAVSTAAQEAKNPKRDMPIGILGSLAVCTVLYILFGHVLTGIANWQEFLTVGKEATVSYAITAHMPGWGALATWVSVAILAGFSSVILLMLMGQSRIFYTMSRDGLLPNIFSHLHPKFSTPYKSNLILLVLVGLFGAFVPGSVAGDLSSFGTLFAFVLVCIGILVMRRNNPNAERPFRTPFVPVIPILGALICLGMIVALDGLTQMVAGIWMLLGLAVYFIYSRHHSKVQKSTEE